MTGIDKRYLINEIQTASNLLRPVALSFEIKTRRTIIRVRIKNRPMAGERWCVEYDSKVFDGGWIRLQNVNNQENATVDDLANAICKELEAGTVKNTRNVRENYMDVYIPQWIQSGPVMSNHQNKRTKIRRPIVYVLFADIRGFSKWSLEAPNEDLAALFTFMSEQVAQISTRYRIDFWKLLGDGIMLVWEDFGNETDTAGAALGAAYELHKRYWHFKKNATGMFPDGFGIAVCGGYATKIALTTFFESCIVRDYLGPTINHAARLQTVAEAGQVLVNQRVVKVTKHSWYSFKNVSSDQEERLATKKGIPAAEKKAFMVSHKHFGPDWETFCVD